MSGVWLQKRGDWVSRKELDEVKRTGRTKEINKGFKWTQGN